MQITIVGQPSQAQLKDWYEKRIVVSFTEKTGELHHGEIKIYNPVGSDDAVLWIENAPFGFYLRNIATYTFTPELELESIFVEPNSDLPDAVALSAESKIFWVNKKILSQRLNYFRAMFQSGMKESSEKFVDLGQMFSFQELEILLSVVNTGTFDALTLEQAQILMQTSEKIAEIKLLEEAQVRINECILLIQKEFVLAVRDENYDNCTKMLSKGANINGEFGKHLSHCCAALGLREEDTTALIFAVKMEKEKLVEFLLKNGANTDVFDPDNGTPLMIAAYFHKVRIVKLLLEAGANPNIKCYSSMEREDLTAMHKVFFGLRDWLLDRQKGSLIQIVDLLINAGFTGRHNDIVSSLKARGYEEPICDLFTQVWESCHNKNLENSYVRGAMVGAFNNQLPPALSSYIGTFLGRKEGGRLAQTCKQAAITAHEYKAEAMKLNAK